MPVLNFETASKEVIATSRGVKPNLNFKPAALGDEIVAKSAGLKIFMEMRTANALQLPPQKNSGAHFSPASFFPRRQRRRFLITHGRR
jgi:hypothetical protein